MQLSRSSSDINEALVLKACDLSLPLNSYATSEEYSLEKFEGVARPGAVI